MKREGVASTVSTSDARTATTERYPAMERLNVTDWESGFVIDISVFMPFICLNDRLNQLVSDNITFGKIDERDAIYTIEYPDDLNESRRPSGRQVYLSDIAGDNRLCVETETCQEHLHLLRSRVLRLVKDHKGIVQRPASHEGKRRD